MSGYFCKFSCNVEPLLIPIDASLNTFFKVLSSLLSDIIFNASSKGNPVLNIEDNCFVDTAKLLVEGGFRRFFFLFLFFDFKFSNFLFGLDIFFPFKLLETFTSSSAVKSLFIIFFSITFLPFFLAFISLSLSTGSSTKLYSIIWF